ncbi:MAG: DUF4476 domain-containing protein [Flavobacteriia bacterium]|nr:DUF4476 domain-containing protein [Flavobacteriia bacterium]
MKIIILLSLTFAFGSLIALAQQPVANLTIFSDDGDKFFLYLNGEKQNKVAQTNLRVEDLPQAYYSAKIVFDDEVTAEIEKKYLALTDADGVMQDVTYKIKRDKNNDKMSLKFFSMVPVQQNYTPPANVYVQHYGVPVQVIASPPTSTSGTTVTQTTTTTSTGVGTNNPNNTGINVNAGGINMSININDPILVNGTTQTTTTTTTTSSSSSNSQINNTPTSINVGCTEMMAGDFTSALETIKKQGFDDTRLSTAKQIAGSNCLNTNQISSICKEFGFEESKLEFAKFAYDHCSEKKNYFKVNNVFSFSSSIDELNAYIQER